MAKIGKTVYLTLAPVFRHWDKKIIGFRVAKQTSTKPSTEAGQVAVKLNLSLDSALFEEYMPVVDIEMENAFTNPVVEIDNPAD